MALSIKSSWIRLSEAREVMIDRFGAALEADVQRLAADGELAVRGMWVGDVEQWDEPDAPSIVPEPRLKAAQWDWYENRLRLDFDPGDGNPIVPRTYLEVSFDSAEFDRALVRVGGQPAPEAKRKIGRPGKWPDEKLISYLDDLDAPRGTKSFNQLANELIDRMEDDGIGAPGKRHALRLVKKFRAPAS